MWSCLMRAVFVLLCAFFVDGSRTQTRTPRGFQSNHEDVPKIVIEQLEKAEILYTTPDYARKYGYPIESHTVTTEDGYLLTLHRIPGSPRTSASASPVKTPVFLQHGMGTASDSWLLMGPERGVGFILADEGYDVWLGNARGNRYSSKHVSRSASGYSFYNYTWHEMGVYDLPASIDYILERTNQSQLFYIGHSMGGATFLVLTTMKPEYNQKIKMAALMAPGVILRRPRSSVTIPTMYGPTLYLHATRARIGRISVKLGLPLARFVYAFCGDEKPYQQLCLSIYFTIFGYNSKELNATMLPSIIYHGISGHTVNLLNHYAQLIETERFQIYDRSGRKYSPQQEYQLSKVTAPVSLHYADNDLLVHPEGVIQLSKRLPNLVQLKPIPDPEANHNDFIFAIHIRELVINDLLNLMKGF